MRWPIIRLIFLREVRDQLRDRRTLFMIVVLPIMLYPVLGLALVQFALGFIDRASVIGISGSQHLPQAKPTSALWYPGPAVAWLSLLPPAAGSGPVFDKVAGAAALAIRAEQCTDYPPLSVDSQFPQAYFDQPHESRTLGIHFLQSPDREALDSKQVDVLLRVPAGFQNELENGGSPDLEILYRQDEGSRLAVKRLYSVLAKWRQRLREVRLRRLGLPADFGELFEIKDMEKLKPAEELASQGLLDMLMRIFPFLLVMWSLAGALYPAVDLCAGEKERGTMETLLISPASREEIVWGKFLTIWLASAITALLNLGSMALTTTVFSGMLSHGALGLMAVLWCILLALPLSAFFSAMCLAVGAYARSSKEGQYYLMPLFLVTMPLVFLTLAPGVELNPFYSLVPVTGVALLVQRLMSTSLEKAPWLYFVPVLLPMALYSWLALRWAIEQFKREEVLFREAERLEIRLWLRHLFRQKGPLPSVGQTAFCFILLVGLRWVAFWVGGNSMAVSTAVVYMAFVAAPPLFMAMLLTSRPLQCLALHPTAPRHFLVGILLVGLLFPPLASFTLFVLSRFPGLEQLSQEGQTMAEQLRAPWWIALIVFSFLPALCEELAFRGFILSGLRTRFKSWNAILISCLLYALFHLNAFQILPTFLLGLVLSMLTVWSGSILPGLAFHLVYNGLLVIVAQWTEAGYADERRPLEFLFHPVPITGFAVAAIFVLFRIGAQLGAEGNTWENRSSLESSGFGPRTLNAEDRTSHSSAP
jgi:sodium transport system permease protein